MSWHDVSAGDVDRSEADLHSFVEEEGSLFELTLRSVSDDGTERPPWPVAAASSVLMRWADAGLIGVYRDCPNHEREVLSHDEARHVLAATGE
jgi:hypothetical protein